MKLYGGKSPFTRLNAATTQWSPICVLGRMTLLAPMNTLSKGLSEPRGARLAEIDR